MSQSLTTFKDDGIANQMPIQLAIIGKLVEATHHGDLMLGATIPSKVVLLRHSVGSALSNATWQTKIGNTLGKSAWAAYDNGYLINNDICSYIQT